MSIQAVSSAAPSPPPSSGSASASDWDFSFHNLLDILNPLEHLPIIGTIYRAITGTHIGIPEKVAGDALYGGLWGAVAGVADAAFEAVTGKDLGDTVLALFRGSPATQLTQVTVTPAAQLPVPPQTADVLALKASLDRHGVDGDLAQRAIAAYRKSIAMPSLVPQPVS
jgi:hypothetical protein